jgi:membrane protein implicated in regulation of membrane protease activity
LGYVGIIGSAGILLIMIFPGSPVALAWPFEWAIFLIFSVLGILFWLISARSRDRVSKKERDYLILEKFV